MTERRDESKFGSSCSQSLSTATLSPHQTTTRVRRAGGHKNLTKRGASYGNTRNQHRDQPARRGGLCLCEQPGEYPEVVFIEQGSEDHVSWTHWRRRHLPICRRVAWSADRR